MLFLHLLNSILICQSALLHNCSDHFLIFNKFVCSKPYNNLRVNEETLLYKPVYKSISLSKIRVGEFTTLQHHIPKLNLQASFIRKTQ
uniref:Secreted protein n=1 Tax=Glossina morsitans morsitans TaxID=37546 RepID=A0A1B0GFX6_GLOMM